MAAAFRLFPMLFSALAAGAMALAVGPGAVEACDRWQAAKKSGTVKKARIDEASGLVASRTTPGLLWTMNDQAGDERLFGLSPKGDLVAQYEIRVRSTDWEGLAAGPCAGSSTSPCLYVGDIGGSSPKRREVQVVRFPEPSVRLKAKHRTRGKVRGFEVASFAYPDGKSRDAEAMVVDDSGTVWIFDKDRRKTSLYRAAFSRGLNRGAKLERVAARRDIKLVTGADLSPDQRHLIVRNHEHAYEFHLRPSQDLAAAFQEPSVDKIDLKKERQGEAIAYAAHGRSFFTLSEGKRQPIHEYVRAQGCH